MELFAEIRREYQFGVGTIKGVSRKLGVHRRVVRQALADAVPPARAYRARAKPTLDPVQDVHRSDSGGRSDWRRASSGTRRAAFTIGCVASGRRRRSRRRRCAKYVRGWKRAQGLRGRTVCVPQTYAWGQEAQVDWYEAVAILGDEEVTLQVFCVRSMASGAAFHRAYPRATQQAFLEAHEGAFAVLRGRVRDPAVRQSDQRGPQDPARIPARGDDAVPGVSLALAVRRGVLHAGRRPREGRRGRRGGLLPAESLGAAARRPRTSMR